MAYCKDYKSSKLVKDEEFTKLMDKVLSLDLDEELLIFFSSESELSRTRYNLYSVLSSLERKEDFSLSKVVRDERVALQVKPRVPTTVEVVEVKNKEE